MLQMKQLYGNNAVVVSGSNSIPMMSSQSLASMVQVRQIFKRTSLQNQEEFSLLCIRLDNH